MSFASKEHRSLHTCNSITDRNVSEEGRERSTRRGQSLDENEMFKTLEKEDENDKVLKKIREIEFYTVNYTMCL